ncbi:glycosyltransferase [Phaeobacter sp.]|uniref:glycosyltransferase family 4 protein n=1 Tax=Phaeobacter sp. TaxID=1902409 RepID=UPI0025E9DA6B|nr:glycosyltransferase [Phaeobacter sp.]
MARNLMLLLEHCGARVQLLSELRLYEGKGERDRQIELQQKANLEVERICTAISQREAERPALWLTYHNYYKAPDLIGPHVARRLGIPYVQIESTRANKRLNGPWTTFAAAAHEAADAASVIYYLTSHDHETLERDRAGQQKLLHLAPFLPLATLPAVSSDQGDMTDGPFRLLSVAMMRDGDKHASYTLIAETLQQLRFDWQLTIIGDGPARPAVEQLMAPFGARVQFLGQLDAQAVSRAYGTADLFFWPGVNEAFGMVYLEAQAHGLPVLAQARPGLTDVVCDWPAGFTLPAVCDGAQGLAQRLTQLAATPAAVQTQQTAVRNRIQSAHLLPAAAKELRQGLAPLLAPSTKATS